MAENKYKDYRLIKNTNILIALKTFVKEKKKWVEEKIMTNVSVSYAFLNVGYTFMKDQGYNKIYVYLKICAKKKLSYQATLIIPIIFMIPITKRKVFEITSTNINFTDYFFENPFFVTLDEDTSSVVRINDKYFNDFAADGNLNLSSHDTMYQISIDNNYAKINVVIENDTENMLVTNYYQFKGFRLYPMNEKFTEEVNEKKNEGPLNEKKDNNTSNFLTFFYNQIKNILPFTNNNENSDLTVKLKIKTQ